MARPQTKDELLDSAAAQYAKLQTLIDSMSAQEQQGALDFGASFNGKEPHWKRDQNLRDVLGHLYAWHQMLLEWVNANRAANRGSHPQPFLPAPHTWKTTPALNEEIRVKYRGTPLAQMRDQLAASHAQVIEMIETYSDPELFTKAYFPWTGTTSLGSYCVSATSSHYDWAMKKLRIYIKAARAGK